MNIMSFGILATFISTIIVSGMEYFHFKSSSESSLYFTESIILYGVASVL
jgi:hypothetical protein